MNYKKYERVFLLDINNFWMLLLGFIWLPTKLNIALLFKVNWVGLSAGYVGWVRLIHIGCKLELCDQF